MKKRFFLSIALLLALALLFGCSSASKDMKASEAQAPSATSSYGKGEDGLSGSYEEAPSAYEYDSDDGGNASFDSSIVADPARKMIWVGEITLESTDFTAAEEALHTLIGECGGFIQSSTVTGEGRTSRGEPRLRNARYTIRIPTENFQLFMKSSGDVATVVTSSTNSEDVTAMYFDTEARLRVLEIKEERLIEMLEQTNRANYTDELKYILQLENELGNVRYEIESLTGTLRRYDDLISYSTVTVYLQEVREYTATPAKPESLGERISITFSSTLRKVISFGEDFLVWLVGRSPLLIPLAAIVAFVIFVARGISRRRRKHNLSRKSNSLPTTPPSAPEQVESKDSSQDK
jgi:hypothetical protein